MKSELRHRGVINWIIQYFIRIWNKKAFIISFGAKKYLDKLFVVFVAYFNGKKRMNIQNQPSIGSMIKYQHLANVKSEPRDLGVIAWMWQFILISN